MPPKKAKYDPHPRNLGTKFVRPEEYDPALELVIGQEDLKVKLTSAFSQYTLFLEDESAGRPIVCVYGESGSGKTFAVELLAKYSGLPVTIASAASLSPPSYKGTTLQDLLVKHWIAYHTDVGVLYLDEIDKWCAGSVKGMDRNPESLSNGVRSQHEILRYVEAEEVGFIDIARDIDELSGVVFNSKRMLWVLSGAFVGLPGVIRRRLGNQHLNAEEVWEQAQPDDFIRYGMVDELAKRVQTWAWTKPLNALDLVEILKTQELPRWIRRFEAIGCKLTLDHSALATCALHAYEEHIGARGAVQLLQRSMGDIFYQVSKQGLKQFTVDHNAITTGRIEIADPPILRVV